MMFYNTYYTWITIVTLALCNFDLVKSATLRCYQGDINKYVEVDITTPEPLITSSTPAINVDLPTVFYSYGFTGKNNGIGTVSVISTYISHGDRNTMLLNWEEEASDVDNNTAISFTTSAIPNTKRIGAELCDAIIKLIALGLKLETIHIMGLSLGAQLVGVAARECKSRGTIFPRITGLDPAFPLYDPPIVLTAINSNDAAFVDIIHTDPSQCGMLSNTGHIDFYVNFGNYVTGLQHNQPGCEPGLAFCGNLCSHNRSWQLWLETLANPFAFPAGKANSYAEWVAANGNFENVTYIGYSIDQSLRGKFYLTTKGTSPYSNGEDGLKP